MALVDVVAQYYTLPEQYRRNARWFGDSAMLTLLASLVDGNGRQMFTNALDSPIPINDIDPAAQGILFGKLVYEVPTPTLELYFGDPMWYALGNRTGIRIDSDRNVSTGERTWVIDERADGRVIPTSVIDTNAAWVKTNFAT